MSNALAIAAVTATLRNLLLDAITRGPNADPELADLDVTTKPLDKARNDLTANQLNLFLYLAEPNAAWRNRDMPGRTLPGETGNPPLPLTLRYLITAFGLGDEDRLAHRLMGRAMSILHDHPLLGAAEIRTALAGNDLYLQPERVRVTLDPLSVEEMFKLWSAFQTQYRLSAAYEVSVVLIESARAVRTPLPVLTRGPGDRGVTVLPDLTPPFPTLEEVVPPSQQPAARLGEILTITGHHLAGDSVQIRFRHPLLATPIVLNPEPNPTDTEILVRLRDNPATDPANWPAGFYTLDALISRAGEADRATNELAFALAPEIRTDLPADPPIQVTRNADDSVTISLQCRPNVRPEQRVSLLVGGQEVPAPARTVSTDALTFSFSALAGDYFLRLRVDGADSLLIDRTVSPPVFDVTQQVTIP